MRIANSGFMNSVKFNLATQADQMGRLYSQLSSGKRLQQLCDDPLAMVRAVRAHASLNELAARQVVARQAELLVGATDTALGDVASALNQARDISLEATNATLDAPGRAALAAQVRALQSSLVTVGNTCVQGHYLFSGSLTEAAPLQESDTANLPVLYRGNHQRLSYRVGANEQIGVGFTGAAVFNYPDAGGTRPVDTVDADMFSVLTNLADAIERGDTPQVEQLGEQLDDLHAYAVSRRGQTGVLAQRWQDVEDRATETTVLLTQVLSDEESVDYTSAIVELSNLETAYQAALSLTSRMLSLPSLFDPS